MKKVLYSIAFMHLAYGAPTMSQLHTTIATHKDPAIRAQATLQLGIEYAEKGEVAKAESLFEQAANQQYNLPIAYRAQLFLGQLYLSDETKRNRAIKNFEAVSRQEDDLMLQAQAKLFLAELYDNNNEQKCLALLQEVSQQDIHLIAKYQAYIVLARKAASVQKFEQAIDYCQQAMQAEDLSIMHAATFLLVNIYAAMDKQDQAIALLDTLQLPTAVEAKAVALYHRGVMYRQLRVIPSALADLQESGKSDHPLRWHARYELALAYFMQGDKEQSITLLQELIAAAPADIKCAAHVILGKMYGTENDVEKAQQHLTAASALTTSLPVKQEIELDQARCYMQQDGLEKARSIVQKVIQKSATPFHKASAQYLMAIIYIRQGETQLGITTLKAVAKQMHNPEAAELAKEALEQIEAQLKAQ